jgi:hypothetical protein
VRWSLRVTGCSTSGRSFGRPGSARQRASDRVWRRHGRTHQVGARLGAHFARDARLCSPLLVSDLGLWDEPQVGGVVVTILTSEGSLVRTQLRPPKTPDEDASLGLSGWLSRSSDRRLTVAVDVESWHQAARIVSGWHAGRAGCSCSLNRRGQLVVDPYIGGALRSALWLGHILRPWLHCICGRPSEHPPSSLRGHGRMRSLLGHVHSRTVIRCAGPRTRRRGSQTAVCSQPGSPTGQE